ncbi:hedgehog-interacting protein isoform X1 [Chelonia mydas]|uniref:hedgehog-interacting protein isoform X1 n=2 Tax=Chelonioidea TaxID=27791 RepID=UPI00042C0355|nr:hedgehog-interacting protein isoform X1 [Chelonia mydas]XP_043401687.1 hedgehog-interacting protein isoform X1 [Chelonia mydas]
MMLKMLPFKLLLVAVVLCFFEGDAKFGESGARRRKCLNGNPPRRLKKRDRRMMFLEPASGGEMMCRGLYPRLSCCSRTDSQGLLHIETKIFSVTNNTECVKLLEEIKCAHCSPHAQNLFHSPEKGEASERELALPFLCKDYCKEFYYTCRGQIPGFLQTTADEFCFYYARKDGGLCFPDFPRKQVRGPASNYLDQMEEYDKVEELSRKHKHNCFCIQEVVSGLRQPVGAVHCGDASHRLFILEKEGYVKIFTPEGDIIKEPFLDIHKLVQSGIKGGDERGLLSLAFHPNYKKNGKLYVSYTTNQERWAIGPHDHILRVVEYTVSRKNPHQVDMRTATVFLEVAELHRKHLGGQLLFGPDGFLYIFLGDGMITLDDMEEMDGLSDFTGSVLRLDVDTDLCNVPYSIPRSNPHFNSTNQPPEIFAHGLHNPGRCAVDRHPTDVNINLTILCSDSNGKNRSSARILQIVKGKDYESEPSLLEFKPFSSGPLVGGFVYRGCQSERLYGSYVFGDRNGNFLTLQQSPVTKQWQEKPLCLGNSGSCRGFFSGHILGFGEDELGEVYILSSSKSMTQSHNGKLYKIVDPKRPLVPEECKRTAQSAQILMSECSRHCRNGHCTPTGKCCCNQGWEGEFCRTAKCDPACRHGGVCVRPNKCLCKKGYLGPQCEQVDRNIRRVTRAGILDQIIDMTSYLLDLTSYIV